MRFLRQKGLAALLAALALLLAGCSGQSREITDFSKVGKGLEFSPKYLRQFSSGFQFAAALPDSGQLALSYTNPQNGEVVKCYMQTQPFGELVPPAAVERQEGEVLLTAYQVVYKYVPSDYEPTAADETAQAEGSMLLAWGSDEIEESSCTNVVWQEDGVYYQLFGMDVSLTADELLAMAAEIVNSDGSAQ